MMDPRVLVLGGRFHIIYVISGDIRLESIPNLEKKKVWYCNNKGWILLSEEKENSRIGRNYHQFSVWKPECSKVIDLPPLYLNDPDQMLNDGIIVMSPTSKSGCTVLLFEHHLRCFISCRVGDGSQWHHRRVGQWISAIGDGNERDLMRRRCFAYCNGNLYGATSQKGKMMLIQPDRDKKFFLKTLNYGLPLPATFAHPCRVSDYLLDFGGQLYFVAVAWGGVWLQDIIDVEVFKLEREPKRWIKVTSLDGAAIFISDKYAFSCLEPGIGIQRDCIYVCEQRDRRVLCFNIRLQSVTISSHPQNLPESAEPALLDMGDFRFPKTVETKTTKQAEEAGDEEGIGILLSKDELHNESETVHIYGIPLHIIQLIAEKLSSVDYINFRSVCNAFWRGLPRIKESKVWSNKFLQNSQLSSPLLIYREHIESAIHNLIDPHLGGLYNIQIHEPPLDTATIRYSRDGWLLMSNQDSMFIYHPFLRTPPITLPAINQREDAHAGDNHGYCFGYALSSLPPSPETILVGSGLEAVHYYCWQGPRVGWNEYSCPDYRKFGKIDSVPIFFNEAFYFLSRGGKLGVFELKYGTNASWKTLEELQSPRPCRYFRYNYLAECDGQLLSIFVEYDQSVHVYKLILDVTEPEGMAWEKVTSLGNYVLFVNSLSSFSVITNSPDMKNRIYFPKFFGRGIVYYCMSTHKFYTTENNGVVEDFYNTPEFLHSSWIQTW